MSARRLVALLIAVALSAACAKREKSVEAVAEAQSVDAQAQAQAQGAEAQAQGAEAQAQGAEAQAQGAEALAQGADAQAQANGRARAPLANGETARATIAKLDADAELRPHLTLLREHFADTKGPFVVQRVSLTGPRSATLVSTADDQKPIVIVTDASGVVWKRDRPTAGIVPPVPHVALGAHPDGGVVLFTCVPSVSIVAARIWSEDGNPFADLELFPIDACDALSAAYAPGFGWVVAASQGGGARAQRLREDGTRAWGAAGITLAAPWRAPAPTAIAIDSAASVMFFHWVSGRGASDHLFAYRYDARGRAIWSSPVDVGEMPRVVDPSERIRATPSAGGAVRVELPRGVPARNARAVDIDADGTMRFIAK